ncbi:hypothetical protein STA1M1_24890 [Sinisalibacter aestuarii]|uniref:HTH luxR-type domain-containing protein n=2 Tax=Sinisalibacter aestuarii TaxID=2949426 RepID=A0ABQ5LUG2_9RHOB|nr:hypothetical protein STA1M1_24890 [Sinisalibacter aestuarii]
MPLPEALRKFADRFGSDLIAVTRVDHSGPGRAARGGAGDRVSHARIVAYDRRANLSEEIGGFRVSYAEAVCGEYLATSKAGSVWHARRADFDHVLRLRAPLLQRRLNETVVVPLEHHVTSSDYLEMHFANEVGASMLDRLGLVAPTLSESWKRRAFGILSKNVLAARRGMAGGKAEDYAAPILGIGNEYRLSRSEYRVCLLLSRGLNNDGLLDELSISLSTLRTHLRNIYAKTGAGSQAELVQRLLVPVLAPPIGAGGVHVA